MDVNTFADWSIVLLGAALCLFGLLIVGFTLFVQVTDKSENHEMQWAPLILAGTLIWIGVALLNNFETLSNDSDEKSTQQDTR